MTTWVSVCNLSDIDPDTGVCALLNGEQVALFRWGNSDTVYAINNFDPFGKANVLSRGLIGSVGERPVVASPLYKQHFDLITGECLEDATQSVKIYPVKVEAGIVALAAA